jgi:obg-like ATPase 1
MPKKGKEESKDEGANIFGRPSNTLRIGLVGMPNVGKSTSFNFLSNLAIPAENYPFCTIDPNLAQINIPDKRYDELVELYAPKSKVSATLKIYDIAGLVKGASENKGLGNEFLSHIKEVDGIFHVVRAFDDDTITHDEGDVEPLRDMEIICHELIQKDKQGLGKKLEDLTNTINRKNLKPDMDERDCLERVLELFETGKWIKDGEWSAKEIGILNNHYFLTAKPVVYLVNISEEEWKAKKNKWLPKVQGWIKENCPGIMIPYSAEYERRVVEETKTDLEARKEF